MGKQDAIQKIWGWMSQAHSKHYLSCDVNGDKNQEGDKAGKA